MPQTKFRVNPLDGSRGFVENMKNKWTERRTDGTDR